MNRQTKLGGTFTLPGTSLNLYRLGYGAMQLAGPGVWGRPSNIDEAVAVLRDAVAAGVNHIGTSDLYGARAPAKIPQHIAYPRYIVCRTLARKPCGRNDGTPIGCDRAT